MMPREAVEAGASENDESEAKVRGGLATDDLAY
jgi:hypothetical protein